MAKNRILLAMGIPVIILLSLTFTPLMALYFGETIQLETMPVDPMDLFRGQHVILDYQISEVTEPSNASEIEEALNQKGWLTVYGILEKKDKYYVVNKLSLEKPQGLYLKGKLEYVYQNDKGKKVFKVNYNLDKYFVPEGTGSALEEASRNGKLIAKVKVYNGYALLTDLKTR